MGTLELDCLELVDIDPQVAALRYFVAAPLVLGVDHPSGLLVDHLLLQPVTGPEVDLVKMRFLGLCRRRIERDRTCHRRTGSMTLSSRHGPPFFQPQLLRLMEPNRPS